MWLLSVNSVIVVDICIARICIRTIVLVCFVMYYKIMTTTKPWAITRTTINLILLICIWIYGKFLVVRQWKYEWSLLWICCISIINFIPNDGSISSNDFTKLCFNKSESMENIITLLIELTHWKAILTSSIKQFSWFYLLISKKSFNILNVLIA